MKKYLFIVLFLISVSYNTDIISSHQIDCHLFKEKDKNTYVFHFMFLLFSRKIIVVAFINESFMCIFFLNLILPWGELKGYFSPDVLKSMPITPSL